MRRALRGADMVLCDSGTVLAKTTLALGVAEMSKARMTYDMGTVEEYYRELDKELTEGARV